MNDTEFMTHIIAEICNYAVKNGMEPDDALDLIAHGFVFTRYLATEYEEYDLETCFIKETCLKREEIDIEELFGRTEDD